MIPLNLVRFLEKNYVECFSFGPDQWARLISTEGFIGINGATPLTTIPGFTPWRPQAWNKIFKLLSFCKMFSPPSYLLTTKLLVEEILLICSLSHYLQSFIHPRWCRISAINSMKKNLTIFKFWHFPPQNCLGNRRNLSRFTSHIGFGHLLWQLCLSIFGVDWQPQHLSREITGWKIACAVPGGILNGVLKSILTQLNWDSLNRYVFFWLLTFLCQKKCVGKLCLGPIIATTKESHMVQGHGQFCFKPKHFRGKPRHTHQSDKRS